MDSTASRLYCILRRGGEKFGPARKVGGESMTNTESPSSNPPPQPDEMSLKSPQECGTDSHYSSTVSILLSKCSTPTSPVEHTLLLAEITG